MNTLCFLLIFTRLVQFSCESACDVACCTLLQTSCDIQCTRVAFLQYESACVGLVDTFLRISSDIQSTCVYSLQYGTACDIVDISLLKISSDILCIRTESLLQYVLSACDALNCSLL